METTLVMIILCVAQWVPGAIDQTDFMEQVYLQEQRLNSTAGLTAIYTCRHQAETNQI